MWGLWDAAVLAAAVAWATGHVILAWMCVASDVQLSEGWATRHIPRPKANGWRALLLGDLHARLWPPDRFFRGLAAAADECGPTFAIRALYPLLTAVTDAADAEAVLARSAQHQKATYILNGVNLLLDTKARPNMLTAATGSPGWRAFRHATVSVVTPTGGLAAAFPVAAGCAARAAGALEGLPAGAAVDLIDLSLSTMLECVVEIGFGSRLGAIDGFAARLQRAADRGAAAAGAPVEAGGEAEGLPRVPPEVGARAPLALLAASEEAGLYSFFPYRNIPPFRLSSPAVRAGLRTFASFREVVDAVLAAAASSPACAAAAAGGSNGGGNGGGYAARGALYARLAAAAAGDAETLRREAGLSLDAGAETMAQTVAWTLGALAFHPEMDARVAAELEAAGLLARRRGGGGGGGSGGGGAAAAPRLVEWGDLQRLPYLTACVKESLRLYPAAGAGTFRRLAAPLAVRTRAGARAATIPAGCKVWVPIWLVHRSTDNWGPDALEYKPERWLDAGGEGGGEGKGDGKGGKARPPELRPSDGARRFYAFSSGARDCPGRYLAMALVTGLLAVLLGRYRFEPGPSLSCEADLAARAQPALVLQRAGGMPLIPVRR